VPSPGWVLLAALGIYGVVAYAVLQRRKEIGVRMLLEPIIVRFANSFFRYGMAPYSRGLGMGVVTAQLPPDLIGSLLFGVGSLDPFSFLGAPLLLEAPD